jgi:hypothetical protein
LVLALASVPRPCFSFCHSRRESASVSPLLLGTPRLQPRAPLLYPDLGL